LYPNGYYSFQTLTNYEKSCEPEGKISPKENDWHEKSPLTFCYNVKWRRHKCEWQFIYDMLGFAIVDIRIMKYKSATSYPFKFPSWENFWKRHASFYRIGSRYVLKNIKIQSFLRLSNHENYTMHNIIWIKHTLLIFTNKQHNNERYTYRR